MAAFRKGMQEPVAPGFNDRETIMMVRSKLRSAFFWCISLRFVLQNIFNNRSQVGQEGQRVFKGKEKEGSQGQGALTLKQVELRECAEYDFRLW